MINYLLQVIRRFQRFWYAPLLEERRNVINRSVGLETTVPSLHSLSYKKAIEDSYFEFENEIKRALIFRKPPDDIRAYCCKQIIKNYKKDDSLLLEFGVFQGVSINFFAKLCKNFHFYGFDSFEGLPYDWPGTHIPAGRCNLNGIEPKVLDNVTLITGRIEDTLSKFLEKHPDKKVFFTHIDTDIYQTAKEILTKILPRLVPGTIILFDELISYPGWRQGGYKALNEVLPRNSYKYIAFGHYEVAIKIISG